MAGSIELRKSVAGRSRRAVGFGGNDALRKRLRAGWAVSALGVKLYAAEVVFPYKLVVSSL